MKYFPVIAGSALALFIVSAVLPFSHELKAEEWILYSRLSGKGYFDMNSIRESSKGCITVWTKLYPSQQWKELLKDMKIEYDKILQERGQKDPFVRRKVNDNNISYQKTMTEIHCESGSYRYLKMIHYNRNNEIIWSSDDDQGGKDHISATVRQFDAGTPGFYFYRRVCEIGARRR